MKKRRSIKTSFAFIAIVAILVATAAVLLTTYIKLSKEALIKSEFQYWQEVW